MAQMSVGWNNLNVANASCSEVTSKLLAAINNPAYSAGGCTSDPVVVGGTVRVVYTSTGQVVNEAVQSMDASLVGTTAAPAATTTTTTTTTTAAGTAVTTAATTTTIVVDVPPLQIDAAGGAQIGAAILGVWAFAFAFRTLIRMLRDSDISTLDHETTK